MDIAVVKRDLKPFLAALGKYIRHRRMSLGMTQEDLADRARLHRTYISDVERGVRNLTIGACWLIAHGLGIQLTELISAIEPDIEGDAEAGPRKPNKKTITRFQLNSPAAKRTAK